MDALSDRRQGIPLSTRAVKGIEATFGAEFIYSNENGSKAIDKGVLEEFRRISDADVVWEYRT